MLTQPAPLDAVSLLSDVVLWFVEASHFAVDASLVGTSHLGAPSSAVWLRALGQKKDYNTYLSLEYTNTDAAKQILTN